MEIPKGEIVHIELNGEWVEAQVIGPVYAHWDTQERYQDLRVPRGGPLSWKHQGPNGERYGVPVSEIYY